MERIFLYTLCIKVDILRGYGLDKVGPPGAYHLEDETGCLSVHLTLTILKASTGRAKPFRWNSSIGSGWTKLSILLSVF